MKKLFNHIVATATPDIYYNVDEAMLEYVDSDWEDEFDDLHEAYEETGRGQAEAQAINEAIKTGILGLGLNPDDIEFDVYCKLYDALAAHWGLETN